MKKTIKHIYAIGFCLLLLASACKKNELAPTAAGPDPILVSARAAEAAGSSQGGTGELPGQPNAVAQISEPLFNEAMRGTAIEVKKVSADLFVAQRAIYDPGTVVSADPCAWSTMWADFAAFIAANRPTFEAWANANCRPFMSCWCHPCGLCVMFIIQPTRNCPQVAYQEYVKVFA